MKLICSVWHIPIQMLIACRQQMRWHAVIIITDKLEIFIFCRQCPASLTFLLFSWDCPVYDQYSRCPSEDRTLRSESFMSPTVSYCMIITLWLAPAVTVGSVCVWRLSMKTSQIMASKHFYCFHGMWEVYTRFTVDALINWAPAVISQSLHKIWLWLKKTSQDLQPESTLTMMSKNYKKHI